MKGILGRFLLVYKSSGKGIGGLSKSLVGMLIVLVMLVGQEGVSSFIRDNQEQTVELLTKIIAYGGLIVTAYGVGDKQKKLEESAKQKKLDESANNNQDNAI